MTDWDFRILVRSLLRSEFKRNQEIRHVSVQLVPGGVSAADQALLDTLLKTLSESLKREMKVAVFWGGCDTFAAELRRRLRAKKMLSEEDEEEG